MSQAQQVEAAQGRADQPWHSEYCRAASPQAPEPASASPAPVWNPAQGLHRQSLTRAHALALSCAGSQWSYAQLTRQAAGLAAHWRAQPLWPGPDEAAPRVGILASRSAEACIAALAAHWAGATYVPLGLGWPEERIRSVMARCRLSALVADAQGARLLSEAVLWDAPAQVQVLGAAQGPGVERVKWLSPHELAQQPLAAPQPMALDQAAYILFTSGSTGEPKGVVVPVGALRHYVPTMTAYLGLQPSDRVLDLFELSFDVSVHNMLCTWEAGASLHMLPAAQVMNAVRFVREHGLTVWSSVPSLVGLLAQVKALSPGAMPSLRLSSFGGEQLSCGIVKAWQQVAPRSAIYNLYGPTEATVTCLALRVTPPWPCLPGSDVLAIGQALPGCDIAVLDPQGLPVADGQSGELAVSGVQLASGYLDAPLLTAARFVQRGGRRWYLTGDLVRRDEAGLVHCLGRMDRQVKVRGHRIELEDVEAHVRQVSDADLVAAVAWPGTGASAQALVAFVSGGDMAAERILQALRERVPGYMLPSRVLRLAHLPTNASGKVDRQALCRLLAQDPAA